MSRGSLGDLVGAPQRSDLGLAALFLLPSLAQVLLDPIADRLIGVVFALGSVFPLAWRRTHTLAAAWVGTVVWLLPTQGYLYLGYVIAVVLFFSVGAYVTSNVRVLLITAWCSAVGGFATLTGPEPPFAVLSTLLVILAPVVAGRLVAHQREQTLRLQELTDRLQDERVNAERTAVAEERARIARELHDVVGHDVTVIALQAEAAAAAIVSSPDLARAPIAAIRESAHQALDEMRRVLGGLRVAESESGLHPQPGANQIRDLVERAGELVGSEIDLTVDGVNVSESPSVGLAVYRIVQESLTNARRHAPGSPVRIRVAWSPDGVEVTVTNRVSLPVAESAPGLGLVGMRERVRLLGGRLHTGLDDSGLFGVVAYVPYDRTRPT